MKKLTLLSSTFVFALLLSIVPVQKAHAAAVNLILNPDVETGTTQPTNWQFGSWGGTVATSTYSTTTGSNGKALGVSLTTLGSGDAKWYNDPITVTPGKTYTFSDSYSSTVGTEVVLQYTVGANAYQYEWLGNLPASSAWTPAQFNFTVPANVTSVSVFHLIAAIGDLWTDNFSLVETTVVTPPVEPPAPPTPGPADNQIANPSLETTTNGTTPDYWQSNSWGTNTSTFEYANSGNTGTKSAHVTTTSYTNGDSKWYPNAVALTPGETYTFKDAYKSTIGTEVVMQYTLSGGAFQYIFLGSVPASANWSTTQFNFTVPASVTNGTVFHLIAGVGDLWTDDYSIVKVVTTPPPPPPGPTENQIINPSVETANGNTPANWQSNAWGTNTAVFDYANQGYDGTRSVHVTVSNYVDGDAKWFHSPVTVSADSQYIFSDFYKSSAPSETVLQLTHSDNTVTYQWLGTNPIAANWTKSEFRFIIADGITSVTIFHVMGQNGELWTDKFDLREIIPDPNASHVPNGNLETEASATLPTSWHTNSWGTNTTQFEYLKNFGNNSNHSVKVTVSSYTDGDAKWYNDPVALTPGVDYKVTDFYQSDTDSRVVLAVLMQNGTTQYLELPTAPANANWTQYVGTFTMPTGAMSVSIYHLLSRAGFLITDNFDITEYNPVPFNKALLTLTFDDSWEDNVTTALPLMNQHGYKSDQFFATTFVQNADMGEAQAIATINQFIQSGHEIGSHTVTHPDLTTLTAAQVNQELIDSKTYLENTFNVPINYFATPFGIYNQAVKDQIMANYTLHRTVDVGFNSKDNFDISRLKVQNVLNTTTAADVAAWVAQAQKEGSWLILLFHRVATDAGTYDTTPAKFGNMLNSIQSSGINVVTISQALAELTPQL